MSNSTWMQLVCVHCRCYSFMFAATEHRVGTAQQPKYLRSRGYNQAWSLKRYNNMVIEYHAETLGWLHAEKLCRNSAL